MHIHIANLDKNFHDLVNKNKPAKFGTSWVVIQKDRIIMMCPIAKAPVGMGGSMGAVLKLLMRHTPTTVCYLCLGCLYVGL